MIYDISENSITTCYDTFSRELNSLHNNNKMEEDEKNIKDIQKKIALINTILNNLNKLKLLIKIK